jgi:hypothetical protein
MSDQFYNKRYGSRQYLTNKEYHTYEKSIPKEHITPELEPKLFEVLDQKAKEIVADPSILLLDIYTSEERKKDWKGLVKKSVLDESGEVLAIDARSRPGHKILDHHMPHFWDVTNWKGVSVKGMFTYEKVLKALVTNVQMHSTPYCSEIRRMLIMTGGLGNVTKYRAATAKAVVSYYKATSVFDPCIGWGGRMLGALAAGASYTGCEPDPKTAAGLIRALGDLPADVSAKAKILETVAEEQVKKEKKGSYDMILTSPPYFNLELYTGGPQSTNTWSTWDLWVEHWLKPVVLGCLELLKGGGTSCWSVKNFKSDKLYPLADAVKKIHEDAGWTLNKTFVMKGSGRPGAGRIQEGKATRESEEETFCYRKA